METGHSYDDYLRSQRLVNDSIRETPHLAPADCSAQRMPSQRKVFDALNGLPSLVPELIAEMDSLQVVVVNCRVKLTAGRQEKPNLQPYRPSSANASSTSIAASSPSPVGRNAIFGFLEP